MVRKLHQDSELRQPMVRTLHENSELRQDHSNLKRLEFFRAQKGFRISNVGN